MLHVWVEESVEDSHKCLLWIVNKVVPKLIKWMGQEEGESNSPNIKSLSLLGVTKYSQLYRQLKETYSKQLVQVSQTSMLENPVWDTRPVLLPLSCRIQFKLTRLMSTLAVFKLKRQHIGNLLIKFHPILLILAS